MIRDLIKPLILCSAFINVAFFINAGAVAQAAEVAQAPDLHTPDALNFEFFRTEVQPLFLAKRPGNIACATCHAGAASSQFRLQPLSADAYFWNEEQSRLNYAAAAQFVVPGAPLQSRLLTHPLGMAAGGDPFHGGGKHWNSGTDPEWKILSDWANGATTRSEARTTAVRIIQTNAAGDDSHVIDPLSNQVVGVISDVHIPHGITSAPDGSELYISNEALHTLDVIDSRTLRVVSRIPLSGRPNNVAVSKFGDRVYVAIMEMPGSIDIIDTATRSMIKTLPVDGAIHNVYVTPDGRFAVGGSIHTRTINVIDTRSDEVAWKLQLDAGIRPMAFDTHEDGSTKNIYVQLSNFHGFAVVDFTKQQEIARIEHPAVEGVEPHFDGLQSAPTHGLAVSPDGKTLWSTSKVYGYAYVHSLPDLKEIGQVFVGQHPEWITFTPDGKSVYIAAAGDNATFAVDAASMKEIARIPVGQVPKRNATVLMQQD